MGALFCIPSTGVGRCGNIAAALRLILAVVPFLRPGPSLGLLSLPGADILNPLAHFSFFPSPGAYFGDVQRLIIVMFDTGPPPPSCFG